MEVWWYVMKRRLTPKQEKFADEYIISGNAAEAARKAGYSKKTARTVGQQNLTKLDIKEYIDEQMAEIASERIMDATEAVELLTSIARGDKKETVYVPTIDGDVVEKEKPADFKTVISAVRELLKRYPGDDRLVTAQINKAEADADISTEKARIVKHQADEIEGVGRTNPLLVALTKKSKALLPKEVDTDANTTD